MKNKKMWTIVLSVIAVIAIVVATVKLKQPATSKYDGQLQVVVVDIEGKTLQDKTIGFNAGDDVVELLKSNFDNVVVNDGFLYSIDTLTTPEDWSSFICLYVDDAESQVGITQIELKDKMKISFVDTKISY